jgi:hypothetical protein
LSSDDTVLGQGLDAAISTVLDTLILLVETPKSGASYYAEGSIPCFLGREDRPAMLGVSGEVLLTTLGMGGPDDD